MHSNDVSSLAKIAAYRISDMIADYDLIRFRYVLCFILSFMFCEFHALRCPEEDYVGTQMVFLLELDDM